MKKTIARFAMLSLVPGLFLAIAPRSQAQAVDAGQPQKLGVIGKQLNLTPEQEKQLMPILDADAPKIQAIKNNAALPPRQKMEKLQAIYAKSDAQVKEILNPQQYEQLQQLRQQEIQGATQKKQPMPQ